MAWLDDAITILRNVIGDDVSPYSYSDSRLEEILGSASSFVISEISFDSAYVVDVSIPEVTPDPSGDNSFIALVVLKAACIIGCAEHRNASRKAMSFRDGPSSIDGRGVADHAKFVAQDLCKKYEDAKFDYVFGDGSLGVAIIGPYTGGGEPSSIYS